MTAANDTRFIKTSQDLSTKVLLENILPVEVFIKNAPENGLEHPSKILCDSPFTWNKELRLEKKLGEINWEKDFTKSPLRTINSSLTVKKVKKTWKIAF